MSSTDEMDLSNFSMLDLFRTEVDSQTAILSSGLIALEESPQTPDGIEPLMRAAHSIKGAARIVQIDSAEKIAHVMEDCFVAVREGTTKLQPEDVDTLLSAVDLLQQISRLPESELKNWESVSSQTVSNVLNSLRAVLHPSPPPKKNPTPVKSAIDSQDLSAFSMLDLFRTEVDNQTQILNDILVALESENADQPRIEALMRAAHSIKGAARIVQLNEAEQIAHVMEDCFLAIKDGKTKFDPAGIDVLLQGIDWLIQISRLSENEIKEWSNQNKAAIEKLLEEIQLLGKGLWVPPASEVAPQIVPPQPQFETAPVKQAAIEYAPGEARAVKVTAENLNRLMGLAGESLVEANWLKPFADSLLKLKNSQVELSTVLDKLQETMELQPGNNGAAERVTEARTRLNECRQNLVERLQELESFARRSANLSGRLYREVIASRMRPFSDGTEGFPRMVRDVARKLGKKVKLEILGKTTKIDRDILEKLEAPLNHLLRNSIDHGIELPEERIAKGKSPEGLIRLDARHKSGLLAITVSDDGRGIDLERLRQKVVYKNFVTAEMAAKLSEAELMEFLFLPGFSTAEKLTEISGRGYGLDIVYSIAQEVGGSVRAVADPGMGMTFHLQLPLTLSVIRTLIAEISGEPFAFPLARIDRSLLISREEIQLLEDRQYVTVDGENVGLISAHQVLELPESASPPDSMAVILVSDQLNRYGLVVDGFLGQRDLVVRPLDPRLGKIPDLSSAAILEDGTPVLIIDVQDMVRSIDNLLTGGRLGKVSAAKAKVDTRARKRILVVDDSITVREVERKLLENRGYEVEVAVNGMDGWNAVRSAAYDLVITDIDMPRMNGIEFVTLIKNDSKLRSLPVMIISYKDREEDRQRGLQAGANYYLTKSSFHDETLIQAVSDLIGEA